MAASDRHSNDTDSPHRPVMTRLPSTGATSNQARASTSTPDSDLALREREMQLRQAMEAAHAGAWKVVPATGEFTASDRAVLLHGLSPGTPLSHAVALSRVHPDDRACVEAAMQQALTSGAPFQLELRVPQPDGSMRWVLSQAECVDDGQVSVVGLVQDITDRKRRELNAAFLDGVSKALAQHTSPAALLQTAAERLGEFLHLSGCVFCDVAEAEDAIAVHSAWNRAGVCKIDESVADDLRRTGRAGEPFVVADTQADARVNASHYAALDIGAVAAVHFHWQGRWVNSLAVTDTRARVWRDDEIALLQELSDRIFLRRERARAELALRENEERLALAIDVGQLASWDWNLLTGRVTWNDRHFVLQGYDVGEVTPSYEAWIARVHPDDRARTVELIEAARHSRHSYAHEFRTQHPSGAVRWCSARGHFFYQGDEPYRMVGVMEDVTDRKASELALHDSEERLRLLNEQLEQRVRERTREVRSLFERLVSAQEAERRRIARDLHDDLGQQMTALRINLEGLSDRKADWGKQLARTQRLAEELDRSIDSLTWELRPSALDHLGLLPALYKFMTDWSERFSTPFTFEDEGESRRLPPDVEANVYRLAQEAMHNVAKHASASRVTVTLSFSDDEVRFTIEDDGCGFEAAACDAAGAGLGLISMRERAALIGGQLEIRSAMGSGTVVALRVPVP